MTHIVSCCEDNVDPLLLNELNKRINLGLRGVTAHSAERGVWITNAKVSQKGISGNVRRPAVDGV